MHQGKIQMNISEHFLVEVDILVQCYLPAHVVKGSLICLNSLFSSFK